MAEQKRPSLAEISELLFAETPSEEPTQPQPNSLSPNDPICQPVSVERERRKQIDGEIALRLSRVEVLAVRAVKFSRWTAIGMGVMVVSAFLEYSGLIGRNQPPVWASAVIDGARFAIGLDR